MLEKAELTLIIMLSKTKKVITTPPPVLCSVASCKLFYSTVQRVGTLSLLFVPPAKGGGMEIIMKKISKRVLIVGLVLAMIFSSLGGVTSQKVEAKKKYDITIKKADDRTAKKLYQLLMKNGKKGKYITICFQTKATKSICKKYRDKFEWSVGTFRLNEKGEGKISKEIMKQFRTLNKKIAKYSEGVGIFPDEWPKVNKQGKVTAYIADWGDSYTDNVEDFYYMVQLLKKKRQEYFTATAGITDKQAWLEKYFANNLGYYEDEYSYPVGTLLDYKTDVPKNIYRRGDFKVTANGIRSEETDANLLDKAMRTKNLFNISKKARRTLIAYMFADASYYESEYGTATPDTSIKDYYLEHGEKDYYGLRSRARQLFDW